MQTISIALADRAYDVVVGYEIAPEIGAMLRAVLPDDQLLVVTDTDVQQVCLAALVPGLQAAGYRFEVHAIPAGEAQKSFANAAQLWDKLVGGGYTRNAGLLAVGGGVVSDLTGFVASTFMRGIRWAAVPTSMMSQLDASIGGKTAINLPQAKNVIGSFYQPRRVLTDTAFLRTLPKRELSSGLAEAVKYGLLIGDDFLKFMESNATRIFAMESGPLTETLLRCIRFKAGLIAMDERDEKERMVLNLGHTLGHSLEKLGNYEQFRHGEAVAIGLVFATRLAVQRGVCQAKELAQRTESLLNVFQLPTRLPEYPAEAVLDTMRRDKKVCRNDQIRFIFPITAGQMTMQDIPCAEVLRAIQEFGRRP